MKTTDLSPEKSFELITEAITEARTRFEENGFIYIFWGALLAVASIGQFMLLQYGYYHIHYYPYFLTPLGLLFTAYYRSKKKRKSKQNQIRKIMWITWLVSSLNIMILGFVFWSYLQKIFIPITLILLSVGVTLSGALIKSRLLFFSGIIINLSAFVAFEVAFFYQPLLMGIVSIVTMLIPGILLMIKHKK